MPNGDEDHAPLRLPARGENLEAFRTRALAAAKRAGLSPQAERRLELVFGEALINTLRNAYPDARNPGPLELDCSIGTPGRLVLTLRDWGPARPEREGGGGRPGGLGLLLLRSISEAEYRREHGANVLTLRFGDGDDGAPF